MHIATRKKNGMRKPMTKRALIISACVLILAGCGTTQQFVPLPENLDRSKVPGRVIDMKAKHFEFAPDVVNVKAGTLVTLRITALDGTHGFDLPAFGIDVRIDEGETKEIAFFVPRAGEYSFHCSHLCGLGHFGMNGKVVVE
jgi:cytochrome c oxidase subunit II